MSSATFELNNKIYRAGAGAGKTTSLIKEVYSFYKYHSESNNTTPRVVLTTFTRKATQEMRERLMLKAQELNDNEFLNFVISKNNLHISTIHGVLQIFLKQYGYLIELDPGFSITSSAETFRSASRILKSIMCSEKEFQDILETFEFKVLVQNALKFFEHLIVESDLQSPTLKDFHSAMSANIQELKTETEAVAQELASGTDDPKYLARASHFLELEKLLTLEGWLNNPETILETIATLPPVRLSGKNPQISVELNERMKLLVKGLEALEEPLYAPESWNENIEHHEKLEKLFKAFCEKFYEHKCNSGQLQMSDLEILAYKLLKARPDALEDFSKQWDYWLIDEFQDTSPLQVLILDSLINKKPHFIVGDPQQSIYFFRGARQEVFHNKQKQIQASNGVLENLSINYRARPDLMFLVNDMFQGLNFMKMTSPQSIELDRNLAAHFVSHENQKDEIQSVVRYILDLIDQNIRCEDIAVITRKNADLHNIAAALSERNIPYFLHAATGFGGRREILDALSLLKFLVHPFDNHNLISLLRSPWFHLSDDEIASRVERGTYFWHTLLKSSEEIEAVARLKSILELTKTIGISRAFEKGIFDSGLLDASYVYDPSGRREANIWKLIVQLRTEEHRTGFNYLDFIQGFKKSEDIGDDHADAVSSIEPNRVNLMTVHVSKGLEFKYVVLPFISKSPVQTRTPKLLVSDKTWHVPVKLASGSKQVLPLSARPELERIQVEELEENKRLLYVAATRAKNQLFMTFTGEPKKNSWLSYLSFTLAEGIHEKEGYRYSVSAGYGDADLIASKTAISPKQVQNVFMERKDWILNKPKQSVTQIIESTSTISIEDILQSLKKSERGIQMHRLFELIHYEGEAGAWETARSWSPEMLEQFSESLAYLKAQTQVPLMSIIQNGKVEWGFVVKGSQWDMEGQVDLWGIENDELWIVDYKTGNPNFREKAFKQLALYSLAVQKYAGSRRTNLCAVFPNHGIIEVRKSPDLSELEKHFME